MADFEIGPEDAFEVDESPVVESWLLDLVRGEVYGFLFFFVIFPIQLFLPSFVTLYMYTLTLSFGKEKKVRGSNALAIRRNIDSTLGFRMTSCFLFSVVVER